MHEKKKKPQSSKKSNMKIKTLSSNDVNLDSLPQREKKLQEHVFPSYISKLIISSE